MIKIIALISLLFVTFAFSQFEQIFVSDYTTLVAICGCEDCDSCGDLSAADSAWQHDPVFHPALLDSMGSKCIWWDDGHLGLFGGTWYPADTFPCTTGTYLSNYIAHFVDTIVIDPSLDTTECAYAILYIGVEDLVTEITINGNVILDDTTRGFFIVDGFAVDTLPDMLYLTADTNVLEICAYMDAYHHQNIMYALQVINDDTISPTVINPEPGEVFFCNYPSSSIYLPITVMDSIGYIDTTSLFMRFKYPATEFFLGDSSTWEQWLAVEYQTRTFKIHEVDLSGGYGWPCTVFVDSLRDRCGNEIEPFFYVFPNNNLDCEAPSCVSRRLGESSLRIPAPFGWISYDPKIITLTAEMEIYDGVSGIDNNTLGVWSYLDSARYSCYYPDYCDECDEALDSANIVTPWESIMFETVSFSCSPDAEILIFFASFFPCGSGGLYMGIIDKVDFPGPNEMSYSEACTISYRTKLIAPTAPEDDYGGITSIITGFQVRYDTVAFYSGDILTPAFNLNRSDLLFTDYSLLPWAPQPSGSYWDFAAASVYKSDAYIDRIRLFVAEYPNSYDVGVTPSGEIKPWALGALIEPDSTDPEIADDTCCATVFEGPDTMTLYFTVDASDPLELVVREIPSYFFGIDTIDNPGRMLYIEVYNSGQQTWDALDTVPSRSMAGFALVEVDDDYIDNEDHLKLRLIWDSYYAIDIVGIDTIDVGILIDTLDLEQALLDEVEVTSDLTSVDSVYARVGMENALEYRFDYSAPGSDSSQTLILETRGFAVYYEDDDSLEATVNVSTDDITIEEFNTATAVSGAFVYIDDGTTKESGFTNVNGVFNPTADLDYTYDIYVYKMGYRPLKVQHTNTPIYDDEIWYGDVQLLGDAIAESGDTLTILPGTRVWVKPTSAVWNYAQDLNNRLDIMAYGGYIQVFGTENEPVMFRPSPGGSGLYQWAGLFAKNDGSFYVNWATFKYADGVGGAQGGTGPGRMKFVHTRHIGNQGVFADWRNASSQDGWFQLDTCYVEGRVMWFENDDSCWARACSLSQSVTAHECFYTDACSTAVEFEDCNLFDYTYYGGRAFGRINFEKTDFDGTGPASKNYSRVEFGSCNIDAGGANYALEITSTAFQDSSLDSDSSTFQNFAVAGIFSYKTIAFYQYNCIIADTAYTFESAPKTEITVYSDHNYYDTLRVSLGVTAADRNRTETCVPDPGLSKVYSADGKRILPEEFSLCAAIPNPFNSNVAIEFDIPKDAEVVFEIFNILGEKVITLVDEELERGRYRVVWDGADIGGAELPSGTYLYRLRCEEFEETKKMTLIK